MAQIDPQSIRATISVLYGQWFLQSDRRQRLTNGDGEFKRRKKAGQDNMYSRKADRRSEQKDRVSGCRTLVHLVETWWSNGGGKAEIFLQALGPNGHIKQSA